MRVRISLLIAFILLLSGCIIPAPTCETPYMVQGYGCCMDRDDNGICDRDDITTTSKKTTSTRPPSTALRQASMTIKQTTTTVKSVEALKPDVVWSKDSYVQPVPAHASKVRLALPVALDDIILGKESRFQGFGNHINDRIEGVETVSLELEKGAIIRNMADGEVVHVSQGDAYLGCQVQIDYGGGLHGRHHYLKECMVQRGQRLKEGEILGEGNSYEGSNPGFEFLLADEKRSDGPKSEFHEGQAVSMFDYLKPEDQQAFIDLYKKRIIDPYISKGQNTVGVFMWEPYLTNPVLLHEGRSGELTGEWLSTEVWDRQGKPELLSFLEVKNKYWSGRHMRAINIYDYRYILEGEWVVQGDKVLITDKYDTYYGLWEVDESEKLAKLRFEYSNQGYPKEFSDEAIIYVEREPLSLYDQAQKMRVHNIGIDIKVPEDTPIGGADYGGPAVSIEVPATKPLDGAKGSVWLENQLTQPLHPDASKTRLSLPAIPSDLLPEGSQIVGFGAHVGQHIEGLTMSGYP